MSAPTTQCASTQKILDAHARGEKGIDWDAPLVDWKATEESAQPRELPVDQVIVYRQMQQGAERNALGDSETSSVTAESKERAINALICSPPAPFEGLKATVTKLEPVTGANLGRLKKYLKEVEEEKEIKKQARRWWITRLAIVSGIILGLSIWWYLELKSPTLYPAQSFYKGKL